MKIWAIVFSCCCGLFAGFAAIGQNEGVKPFVISYIIYPGLEDYIRLIEGIYTELGFTVTMLPTPASRGLVLLSEGEVDADLLRVKSVAAQYANISLVEPPLNKAELILLCVMAAPCHRDIIHDENVYILTGEEVKQEFLPGEFLAKQISVPSVSSVRSMLSANRLSYAIYAIDMAMGRQISEDFNYAVLKDLSIYHVINKKHATLIPLIEAKLREKLPAFLAKQSM